MVLSVVPFRVIPPPFAVESEGESVAANSIFLSSTVNVVLLTVVVAPLTVLFPVTVKFHAIVILSSNFALVTLPSATWETVDLIDIW